MIFKIHTYTVVMFTVLSATMVCTEFAKAEKVSAQDLKIIFEAYPTIEQRSSSEHTKIVTAQRENIKALEANDNSASAYMQTLINTLAAEYGIAPDRAINGMKVCDPAALEKKFAAVQEIGALKKATQKKRADVTQKYRDVKSVDKLEAAFYHVGEAISLYNGTCIPVLKKGDISNEDEKHLVSDCNQLRTDINVLLQKWKIVSAVDMEQVEQK